MKNRIILSVAIITLGLAGLAGYAYFASLHKVSVVFSSDVSSATFYNKEGGEVKKLSGSGDISLQDGDYYAVPDGKNVAKNKVSFTVAGKDQGLTLDPGYSTDFLAVTLASEQPAITAAAEKAFPLIAQNYTMNSNALYKHGEWFGALLTQKDDTRQELDYYRIILHKKDGVWKVVNSPVLVATKSEFKDVPSSVLEAVNQLSR